jgi:hypothetical protein
VVPGSVTVQRVDQQVHDGAAVVEVQAHGRAQRQRDGVALERGAWASTSVTAARWSGGIDTAHAPVFAAVAQSPAPGPTACLNCGASRRGAHALVGLSIPRGSKSRRP